VRTSFEHAMPSPSIEPEVTVDVQLNHRSRVRLWLVSVLLMVCAIYYVAHYVPAPGNGSDFQVFYAAGVATAYHSDPFDWPAMWRTEQSLYNGGIDHTTPFAFAPYADMPPWSHVLQPITAIPEADAYRIWTAALLFLAAVGSYLALASWPRKPRLLGAVVIAVCPAALFDTRLGQNSLLLVFIFGTAIYLLQRHAAIAAGVCMSLGIYKPHLAVPVAIIVILSAPRELRRSGLIGLVSGCLAYVGIGLWLDGGARAYAHWLGSVHAFSSSIRFQPDLASIPGLYLGHTDETMGWILNVACLLLAAGIVYGFHIEAGADDSGFRWRVLGGGTAAFLALSPYVHTSDQTLLALPLVLLIRPNASGLRDTAVLLAVVTAILAPMIVLTDYHTVGINALPPLFAAIAYTMASNGGFAAAKPHPGHSRVTSELTIGPARG
jgi:Glycosyltransferase family 87